MNQDVENLIRSLELPQLYVLSILAHANGSVSSNKEITSTAYTASMTISSLITPLRRRKVHGECLIIQAGIDPDKGTRWQINEHLAKVQDLKELLMKMQIPGEEEL